MRVGQVMGAIVLLLTSAATAGASVPDATVVPEPVTMILLGSGLAGMGGAALLKRRRKGGQ